MKNLVEIREEIDKIDREIVKLYEARMELTNGVAAYKIATGKQVLDKEREQQKLNQVKEMVQEKENRYGVGELFEQIMSMSRKRQYQMIGASIGRTKTEFQWVDNLPFSSHKVVYQGVEGAYSQMAMKAYFGEDTMSFHVDTWKDAMEAIQNQEADYAVLPIENSSAGIVSENFDLLVEYNNYIVAEQTIKIEHALLGLPETVISDITTVFSHPQALMQSVDFLDEHKEWERVSLKNTAVAAKKIV
ncbi:MAG: prephenate dehydratase domain-containing protein, partial [Lachnospiraceae bacterium]